MRIDTESGDKQAEKPATTMTTILSRTPSAHYAMLIATRRVRAKPVERTETERGERKNRGMLDAPVVIYHILSGA
jgi:hypothetical protein